jgi:hypothetical protein
MKIYSCSYEDNEGWIRVDKQSPEPNKRVKIAHITFYDWNLTGMKWESEGWILKSGTWSIKGKKLIDKKLTNKSEMFKYLEQYPVSHWKEI